MARGQKKNKPDFKWIIPLLFAGMTVVIFMRCASIAQPMGGPRDSLPPLVVSTSPEQRSTRFNGNQIILNFNEYVALRDQQKQFMMSPPAVRKPSLTVKGRSIQVDFQEDLLPDMTYRLDFGYSIVDNNEGNPLGGYAFIFSTGGQTDTLMMSGQVIDLQTRDSVPQAILFFFDARQDSVPAYDSVMFNAQPDAMFRTDSAGLFLADILKDKDYRVYAVLDKNNNQKYEAGTDYIAMSDSVYNPTRMDPFEMWIEAPRERRGMRRRIDPPQLPFEIFMEEPVSRQTILEVRRDVRQRLEILFNSPNAEIVSFEPEHMDSAWFRREDSEKRDTVRYWVAPPTQAETEALPDTIRAKITFMTQDSVWNRQERTENLQFTHRMINPNARLQKGGADAGYADSVRKVKEAKRQARLQKKWLKRARKISRRRGDGRLPDSVLLKDSTLFRQVAIDTAKREQDGRIEREVPENPFKYTVRASDPLNPEKHIRLDFDFPLRDLDSSRITLTKLTEPRVPGSGGTGSRRNMQAAFEQVEQEKIETPVGFRVIADSSEVRQWVRIEADWEMEAEYRLLIPDSVFTDIAFHSNDTLLSTFKVADFSKFGTIILELGAEEAVPGCEYILELLNGQNRKTVEVIHHATAGGKYRIRYLAPGNYHLKVTEDRNRNGKWDTGSLVKRLQPERIRIWSAPQEGATGAGKDIMAKENWEITEVIDLKAMFLNNR